MKFLLFFFPFLFRRISLYANYTHYYYRPINNNSYFIYTAREVVLSRRPYIFFPVILPFHAHNNYHCPGGGARSTLRSSDNNATAAIPVL